MEEQVGPVLSSPATNTLFAESSLTFIHALKGPRCRAERAKTRCCTTTKSDSVRLSRPTSEAHCTAGEMTGSPSCRARAHVCARVCFYTLRLRGQKLSCRSHTAFFPLLNPRPHHPATLLGFIVYISGLLGPQSYTSVRLRLSLKTTF